MAQAYRLYTTITMCTKCQGFFISALTKAFEGVHPAVGALHQAAQPITVRFGTTDQCSAAIKDWVELRCKFCNLLGDDIQVDDGAIMRPW